jgi:hypothetical protein
MRYWSKWSKMLVLSSLPLAVGCVDRRFVVTTNVPAAQVFVDGQPLGPSPVDSKWEYAGEYTFTALAPGYDPYQEKIRLKPKWYMYPPLDLVSEVLYPGRIEDIRRVHLQMQPSRPLTDIELLNNAENLRNRGKSLPPTRFPDDPTAKGQPIAAPVRPATPPVIINNVGPVAEFPLPVENK